MDRVCPLLGLAADGRSVVDGVDPAHRCHAEDVPIPLDRHQQAAVCLTQAHERCERFLQHGARTGGIRPRTAPIADGLISTRLVLAPQPARRGIAGQARGSASRRVAAVLAVVVVSLAAGVAMASGALGPQLVGSPSSPTPSASGTPRLTPSLTPTSSPSLVPATPLPTLPPATPEPTAAPSPAPPPPAPTPPPVLTYVVQQGDTLGSIAASFGTTVAALQAANGLADPNQILVGQVLVLP